MVPELGTARLVSFMSLVYSARNLYQARDHETPEAPSTRLPQSGSSQRVMCVCRRLFLLTPFFRGHEEKLRALP